MRGVTCGVWPGRRGLAAAAVDYDGAVLWSAVVGRGQDARWGLLLSLDAEVGLDYELVVPDWLARHDGIAHLALAREVGVWVVPVDIVEAITVVGRLKTGPPARTAAALARLPHAAVLRTYLRRLSPGDRRQLTLL